jgi:4-diphosphocytidyl-2-C-methyl-D-erythritol kinase
MPESLKELTVFAPAKVNLHLAVKDRRPDGFHNLESVFLAVDFGDNLRFELAGDENRVEIAMEGLDFTLPPEKNIIFRALSLFRAKTAFNQGLRIRVEKRIPPGGGLGGGSSDAAAALLAMNRIAGFPLNRAALLEIAAALGSDVPFFIYESGAAWVTGRGENIRPIETPRLFLVLVNPGFSSCTAAAFKLLDEYRALFPNSTPAGCFWNDFLPVFKGREKSVYGKIISQLRGLGANFAGLSGTGSTCFGVFRDRELAEKAAESLRGMDGGCPWNFVESVSTVS